MNDVNGFPSPSTDVNSVGTPRVENTSHERTTGTLRWRDVHSVADFFSFLVGKIRQFLCCTCLLNRDITRTEGAMPYLASREDAQTQADIEALMQRTKARAQGLEFSWANTRLIGPADPDISPLIRLYQNDFANFWQEANARCNDDTTDEEYENWLVTQLEIPDSCLNRYLESSFACTWQTLDTIHDFADLRGQTIPQTLARQNSYAYRTYYFYSLAYNTVRNPSRPMGDWMVRIQPSDRYNNRFFEGGSTCQAWRLRFNQLCQRVRSIGSDVDYDRQDTRILSHARNDIQANFPHPGTVPT